MNNRVLTTLIAAVGVLGTTSLFAGGDTTSNTNRSSSYPSSSSPQTQSPVGTPVTAGYNDDGDADGDGVLNMNEDSDKDGILNRDDKDDPAANRTGGEPNTSN